MALHRSRNHKIIAGVCGGIADYLGWRPTVVRLLFILSFLIPGPQLIFYFVVWIVVPKASPHPFDGDAARSSAIRH